MKRQELCFHSFRGVRVGDTLTVEGSSADPGKVVASGELFFDTEKPAEWHKNEIMAGTAKHTFTKAGIYAAIIDIAYLGQGEVTLKFTVVRNAGTVHSMPKTCPFTGDRKGDLDTAVVDITVK
jgi:hypothetical protein